MCHKAGGHLVQGMANDRGCNLLGGDAVGVMVNWANVENELIPPLELMAATDTVYSATRPKPCNVTLVLYVYTVMMPQVQPVSWYLTLLYHSITHPGLLCIPRHHSSVITCHNNCKTCWRLRACGRRLHGHKCLHMTH